MKKMSKVMALVLAFGVVGTTTACGAGSGSGKTVVRAIAFETGCGIDWLREAEKEFEKRYENESFEEGKTGVDLKFEFTKNTKVSTMNTSGDDLYFGGTGSMARGLANKGYLASLDDIMKEKSEDRNGTLVSIADKINPAYYPLLQNNQGEFFGLPGNAYLSGLTYDGELFDKNNFYIADPVANGENGEDDVAEYSDFGTTVYFISHKNAKKSIGADGEYGTLDDGLPTSLTELLVLCSKIKESGFAPFTMTGAGPSYCTLLLEGLEVSLSGAEETKTFYNQSGELDYVYGYTNEDLFEGVDWLKKPDIKSATIDGTNGELMTRTVSRYYANAFLDIAYTNGWFSKDSITGTVSHTDAQGNFICSGLNGTETTAMLIEGSYWYTEAQESDKLQIYEILSQGKTTRDVRWMPLPVNVDQPILDASQATKRATAIGDRNDFVLLNKRTVSKPGTLKAAKAFLKMIYSDEWLSYYSGSTGCIKTAMDYEIKDEDLARLSSYHQSVMQFMNDENTDVVLRTSSAKAFLNNFSTFSTYSLFPDIKVGNNKVRYSSGAFGAFKDGYSGKDTFEGCAFDNKKWLDLYNG